MLTDAPHARALFTPVIVGILAELAVSVALRADEEWYGILQAPSVLPFELELGVESRRWVYNDACFAKAERTGKTVLGQHAGFHDLFVPISDGRRVWGILSVGPFARKRPTGVEVLERWQWLSGSSPHPTDRRFSDYLEATFGTLTLEGDHFVAFQRTVEYLAQLASGKGRVEPIARDALALKQTLRQARFVERMWETARSMIDDRTTHIWATRYQAETLGSIGLRHPPDSALVGLFVSRKDEPDQVDDLIRRTELQRATVRLAQKVGGVVAGRVGDHGVALLARTTGSAARRRAELLDLGERVRTIARRLGFRLHLGTSAMPESSSVAKRYEQALAAAERALSLGHSVIHAEASGERRAKSLAALRRELGRIHADHPSKLSARFDQYLEAVGLECGHRLEPARVHLAVGIERATEALLGTGALDGKTFEELRTDLDRAAEDATTMTELFGCYRRALSDIQLAMLRPLEAGRERGTRRAISYLREHLSERVSLTRLAKVAGFAPGYFSKLFKRQEGMTLESYTQQLRLTRAKELLHNTQLSVERVGQLAGFGTRNHFHHVFRRAEGVTPLQYRNRGWWSGGSAHDRAFLKTTRRTTKSH
jgi:AraC-like DNA-binding protein